jgi:tape measure domain-containing protein
MKSVGNAVAAAGGDTEVFLGALRAIGQIRTKGTVQAEELLQLAERGIPAYQILRKELKLTAEQVANIGRMKISADTAIPALLRGFDAKFGGALEAQSATFNGALSNFNDSLEQFKAVAGESLLPAATATLQAMTGLVEKGGEFIKLHPNFMKIAAVFTAITAGGLILGGVYLKLRGNALMAAAAQAVLTGATRADIAAEAAKVPVARAHAAGLAGVGTGARNAATGVGVLAAQNRLARIDAARRFTSRSLSRAVVANDRTEPALRTAQATYKIKQLRDARAALQTASVEARASLAAAEAAAAGAGASAAGGRLAGARAMMGRPLVSGATSALGLNRYAFQGYGRYRDVTTGAPATRSTALAWRAEQEAARRAAGGLRGLAGRTTIGGAASGALTGLGAGMEFSGGLQAAGVGRRTSNVLGGAGGLAVGALTIVAPQVALPVGAALVIGAAIRAGFDTVVNKPAEDRAERGNGLDAATEKQLPNLSAQARAQKYFALRDRQLAEGDTEGANNSLVFAHSQMRQGKAEASAATEARRKAADAAYWAEEKRKREADPYSLQPGGNKRPQFTELSFDQSGNLQRNAVPGVDYQAQRNDEQRITLQIPADAGTRSVRRLQAHNRLR